MEKDISRSSIPSSSSSLGVAGDPHSTEKRPPRSLSISKPSNPVYTENRRDLVHIVTSFLSSTNIGPTTVYASGPGSVMADLRKIVSQCNNGRRVWEGDARLDVRFVGDDRLEW
jgi:hypothetical protein